MYGPNAMVAMLWTRVVTLLSARSRFPRENSVSALLSSPRSREGHLAESSVYQRARVRLVDDDDYGRGHGTVLVAVTTGERRPARVWYQWCGSRLA